MAILSNVFCFAVLVTFRGIGMSDLEGAVDDDCGSGSVVISCILDRFPMKHGAEAAALGD